MSLPGTMRQRQRASLARLGPVFVKVEQFAPDAEAAGLHQAAIQADVQAALKRAGIAPSPNTEPQLLIQADVRKVGGPRSTGNAYTATLLVEVIQPVVIEREGVPKQRLSLATWRLMDYTVLAKESLPSIRARIGQMIGAFIADYKAVNR